MLFCASTRVIIFYTHVHSFHSPQIQMKIMLSTRSLTHSLFHSHIHSHTHSLTSIHHSLARTNVKHLGMADPYFNGKTATGKKSMALLLHKWIGWLSWCLGLVAVVTGVFEFYRYISVR